MDIGADAVDYNAIANQESLSGLETEMRKLEAVAGEIVNEMDYLKKREGKMRDTNGESGCWPLEQRSTMSASIPLGKHALVSS